MQKINLYNVKEHGRHAHQVIGDEIRLAFTYSIGWRLDGDWPEAIIVGQWFEVAHGMLAKICEIQNKPKNKQVRTDVLSDFRCQMLRVDFSWYEFLFGAAIDFYMDKNLETFEAYQCIQPTNSDILLQEKNAPEAIALAQPLVNSKMTKEPGSE